MRETVPSMMQDDFQLTLNHIRWRMRSCNEGAEVVSVTPDKAVERISHRDLADRVDRVAHALARLGIGQGDRVGTFAWNNQRHFELYMGIPCTGAVLHTLNVRLFAEQLVYIINHAEDRVIFVDEALVPLMEGLAPELECVEHYVVIGDGDADGLPGALRYEELLAEAGARAVPVPRARRAPGGRAVLHERNHGQPEGGPLLPPLDQPPLDGHADARRNRSGARRPGAGGGADVPRQRLGAPVRGGAGGVGPDPPRPLPRRRVAGRR